MNTILIPPLEMLGTTNGREGHLALRHLMATDDYAEFYRDQLGLVILDNSAHEFKTGSSIDSLWTAARRIQADEVVIPDVLFDSEATLHSAVDSLTFLMTTSSAYQPRLMIVPQGRSRDDYTKCLWGLVRILEAFDPSWSFTIGLSKDYEVFDGGLHRILKEAIVPAAKTLDADIHCLGWGRNLWALRQIADDFGDQIRSVDSAKPYVYGLAGIVLDSTHVEVPTYPKRPASYFMDGLVIDIHQREAIVHNIAVFEATARGELFID